MPLKDAPAPTTPASFGPIVPYYDELMRGVPYRMWVGYYLLLLSQQESHPKSMLDVCCGTGTMCEMLTREGYTCAGFDISPPMIEEARRKAQLKKLEIQYEVADARSFALAKSYEACFSFFDSLNNLLDPSELEMALGRIRAHLNPGGSLIFDLNTSYAFEARMFDQQDLKPETRLKYKWIGDYDARTRIIDVNMRFWYRGEEFQELHRQRAYEVDEVWQILERTGFIRIHAFNSYTLNPPRARSDRVHFSAIAG